MSATAPIKGVLFDMDDTLIDWHGFGGDWRAIEHRHLKRVYDFLVENKRPLRVNFEQFSTRYGYYVRDLWVEARTTLRAPHMVKALHYTLKQFGFHEDDHISIDDCVAAYAWEPVPGVSVFPDVPAGLEAILDSGLKIGVLTNAFQPMALRDRELEAYGLLGYFTDAARVSAADVGYLKPSEQIFQYALDKMGTKPEETIYVGDNPVADIAGSQGAGMRGLLRINYETPPLTSGLIVPDAAINSFHELLPILDEWGIAPT